MIKTIKKGTAKWWISIALCYAYATKRRKGGVVTIDEDDLNRWIESVNRNPFKKLWILLMNSDIKQREATEEESEVPENDEHFYW